MNGESGVDTSTKAMAQKLLGDILDEHGVDLTPIYHDQVMSTEARIAAAAHALGEVVLPALIDDNNEVATQLSLMLRADTRPNIVFRESEFHRIRAFKGDDILKFVNSLAMTLNQLIVAGKEKDADRMAAILLSSSLISVGTEAAEAAFAVWKQGEQLETAVASGIKSVSIVLMVARAIVTLAQVVHFLGSGFAKQVLGLVINDTDRDLYVRRWEDGVSGGKGADLYMAHGSMKSFPHEMLADGCNLKKRFVTGRVSRYSGVEEQVHWVCSGLYYAEKNFGFLGTEGVMAFAPKGGSPCFLHQFAVPFSKDNGTNVHLRTNRPDPNELPTIFRNMYEQRDVRKDVRSEGFTLTAAVNDKRGGKVGLIATISAS